MNPTPRPSHTPHHRRAACGLLAAVALVGLAGCGAKEPIPITFDPTVPTPPGDTTDPLGSFGTIPDLPLDTLVPATSPDSGSVAVPTPPAVGSAWQNVTANLAGHPSECGNLTMVAAQPGTDVVLAGVAGDGVWALDPSGDAWSQLGQGAGSATITTRASAIVFDPDDSDVFWVAGIYGAAPAVMRTDDGGAMFVPLGDVDHADGLSVDTSDPARQTLLVGRHEVTDVRLSHDGGETWADVTGNLPDGAGYTHFPLALSPTNLLIGTVRGDESGIFVSDDAGATWRRTFEFGVVSAPYVAADGTIVWALDNGNGVVRSTDDGQTWELGGAVQLISNIVDTGDALVAAGPTSLFRSVDGGQAWAAFGPTLPFQPNRLAYSAERQAFFISYADCGEVVLDDAIAMLAVTP